MKAQTAKNAVIVPVGAKGGFVVKRGLTPASCGPRCSSATAGSSAACSTSPTTSSTSVVRAPEGVVRHDGDDPYLVVAADKGTASFSDVANELAAEYGYWLGDAFASGGSRGYDHKEMGITVARRVDLGAGALPRDATSTPTRPSSPWSGIGDMSGDVFGNGMLRSPHLKLVAAFDHRHVFVDPDPDPEASFGERAAPVRAPDVVVGRLRPRGALPRRWRVPARPRSRSRSRREARRVLAIADGAGGPSGHGAGEITPDEVVSAILRAPVDLLWNGGIGTFVKASTESRRRRRRPRQRRGPHRRDRAAVHGRRRGRQPRAHAARPGRVRARRRPREHRRHRQLGRRRLLRPRGQHQDPAARRDRRRAARGRRRATRCSAR